jgi:GAF domain-containing protein
MTGTELQQIRRLCLEIQTEKDSDRFTELAVELYALLDRDKGGERRPSALKGNRNRQANGRNPYLILARAEWLTDLLDSAIAATGADFGDVQLFDSSARGLRIAAQRGFENEFLNYFDLVGHDEGCSCGAALNQQSRIVVADVATDPVFSPGPREMLLRSKVRSVQSTPLISPSGQFVGMVSTHYARPQGPQAFMWQLVDEMTAGFMAKT